MRSCIESLRMHAMGSEKGRICRIKSGREPGSSSITMHLYRATTVRCQLRKNRQSRGNLGKIPKQCSCPEKKKIVQEKKIHIRRTMQTIVHHNGSVSDYTTISIIHRNPYYISLGAWCCWDSCHGRSCLRGAETISTFFLGVPRSFLCFLLRRNFVLILKIGPTCFPKKICRHAYFT